MINQINDVFEKTSHEPSENGNRRPIDREFEGVIGTAIEQAVSQYHNLLKQGLDIEVKRIVEEFEKATSTIDMVIARRVRARLAELVQGEVRRVFDDTLNNAEQTLVDPIWAKARDKHLSFLSDFSQSEE